jgi:hypothetical protein
MRKEVKLKIYKYIEKRALECGSEMWVLREEGMRRTEGSFFLSWS